jgi:hypothetical protein
MCNVCFWCASCIDIEKMATANTKCPRCNNPRLELTPITPIVYLNLTNMFLIIRRNMNEDRLFSYIYLLNIDIHIFIKYRVIGAKNHY